jgi:hypothetical protein
MLHLDGLFEYYWKHNSIKTNGKLHKIIFISSEYQTHTDLEVSFILKLTSQDYEHAFKWQGE